jgi:NADH-quinone oxidoreductase subunit J
MLAAIVWQSFFFLLFALVACAFGVAVVISSNIVRMAFYLILSLGATAGLFFLAGADFVGSMQLMIYVGGTLVLLVFGVMLTAQSPFISMKTRGGEWILAAIVGGSLFAVLVNRIVTVADWYGPAVATTETTQTAARPVAMRRNNQEHPEATPVVLRDARTATRLGMALSGPRVDRLDQPNPILRRGMSSYLLPFEIVSVHLLVVLVGAAYLARTKKRARGTLGET